MVLFKHMKTLLSRLRRVNASQSKCESNCESEESECKYESEEFESESEIDSETEAEIRNSAKTPGQAFKMYIDHFYNRRSR
jgi:hypothetical protein